MNKLIITKEQAGKRIDKFLASNKEDFLYSRGEIIKKIKNGNVLVNGKAVKPSYVLEETDEIWLENFSEEGNDEISANKKIPLDVVFEDENVIAINKQAGIQVHPSYNEKSNTIVNALLAHFPKIIDVHDDSEEGKLRPGIVHRLDKDTSGVMVIAKNKKSFDELKKIFKNREVEKIYIAICEGTFKEKEGIINKPIARSSSYRKQVIARKNTKTTIRNAETHFRVLKEFEKFSLVEAMPKTGRMHQIRIHFASMGHPVVGDSIYTEKYKKEQHDIEGKVKRQLLHAKELKFELFGKKYDFSVPEPRDFGEFFAMQAQK